MGREAICKCDWAGTTVTVKVLLESTELVVRGEIHKRVPISGLLNVEVQSGWLRFNTSGDQVQIFLGAPAAERWAAAIKTPPPSLARKLGITDRSVVRTIGSINDKTLNAALAEAAQVSAKRPDMIVAYVDTPESLNAALRAVKSQMLKSIPVWFAYPKGPGHPLNESTIRSLLRNNGMVDTKVASVSSQLTALRFNFRQPG
jgi:hypothetical protein